MYVWIGWNLASLSCPSLAFHAPHLPAVPSPVPSCITRSLCALRHPPQNYIFIEVSFGNNALTLWLSNLFFKILSQFTLSIDTQYTQYTHKIVKHTYYMSYILTFSPLSYFLKKKIVSTHQADFMNWVMTTRTLP